MELNTQLKGENEGCQYLSGGGTQMLFGSDELVKNKRKTH